MTSRPDVGELVDKLTGYARAHVDSLRQGWGVTPRAGVALAVALLVLVSAVAMPVLGGAQIGGEVRISADPATDGSTYSYPISDLDAASDVTVNLTGELRTEWENVSATSVVDGDTLSTDLSGTADPGGPSANGLPVVEFEGSRTTTDRSLTDPSSFTVNGNTAPENETLDFTLEKETDSTGTSWIETSETITRTLSPGWNEVTRIEITLDANTYGGTSIDITTPLGSRTSVDVPEDDVVTEVFTGSASGGSFDVTLENVGGNSRLDGSSITAYSGDPGTGNVTIDGTTYSFTSSGTRSLSLSAGSSYSPTVTTTGTDGVASPTFNFTEINRTENPSLDVGADGTGDVSHSGILNDGETVSYELTSVTTDTDNFSVGLAAGEANVSIYLQERTQTQDPAVELNDGNWANHTGTLADGETVSLTIDQSALQEGANTVNVSLPSLSADAPPMEVGLEYSHTAASNVSVFSQSGRWRSEYTLNKTFPDARSNATARLAFPDEVVSFRSVDVSRNGGSYETLPTTEWSTDGTDLVADLGDVQANETVSVKATAQKVRTENGDIVVLEPTPPGSALASTVEVASKSDGFHIATNTTQLLTASSTSYDGEDAYSIVDQNGQRFYLPNARNGSTFTAEHVPLEAQPVTGDVLVDLESTSAPLRFRVEAGETGGDQVDYRYLGASSGLEYTLYSLTYDEPRASAASGGEPVVLRDDDTGETLQISSATSTGGTLEGSDSLLEILFDVLRSGGIVAIAGTAVVGLFFAGSRIGNDEGTLDEDQTGIGLSLIGLLVALPITLEVLSPGAISSRIGAAVGGVVETALGPVLVIGTGGVVFLVYTFLQTRKKKAPTLIFKGGKRK